MISAGGLVSKGTRKLRLEVASSYRIRARSARFALLISLRSATVNPDVLPLPLSPADDARRSDSGCGCGWNRMLV